MSRNTFGNTGTLNPYTISPVEVQNGDRFGYKVIAVIHDDHYWCAYRMPTNVPDEMWTTEGNEVSHAVASALFPSMDNTDRVYYNP